MAEIVASMSWLPRPRAANLDSMTTQIGMLLYPGLTQLDLTGPYEVLHRLPDSKVHLLWKTLDLVRADSGLSIAPTTTLSDCPPLDVLFVPGGAGQMALMSDPPVLGFLRAKGDEARWVTSVCTGALLLGAAGLLNGYDAATHWMYMDLLAAFGARPVSKRVVVDRNRVTAGGVTAGIDFGLRILAELAGERIAKRVQLGLEYDPAPPFDSGHPSRADADLVAEVRHAFEKNIAARARAVAEASR
jgi:cyclohexyl-isocyanide hydratase